MALGEPLWAGDLAHIRTVSQTMHNDFADENRFHAFTISAKSGYQVRFVGTPEVWCEVQVEKLTDHFHPRDVLCGCGTSD